MFSLQTIWRGEKQNRWKCTRYSRSDWDHSEVFGKIKPLPVNTDLEVCERAVKAMEIGIYQGEKILLSKEYTP